MRRESINNSDPQAPSGSKRKIVSVSATLCIQIRSTTTDESSKRGNSFFRESEDRPVHFRLSQRLLVFSQLFCLHLRNCGKGEEKALLGVIIPFSVSWRQKFNYLFPLEFHNSHKYGLPLIEQRRKRIRAFSFRIVIIHFSSHRNLFKCSSFFFFSMSISGHWPIRHFHLMDSITHPLLLFNTSYLPFPLVFSALPISEFLMI